MGKSNRRFVIEQLAEIIAGIKMDHPVRVAVDGVDAAGKTMLADELAASLKALGKIVIRASVDGFHHPRAVRYKRGPESPEGYYLDSFCNDTILDELLHPLGPGGTLYYRTRVYDIRAEKPVLEQPQMAPSDAVLLFDGVFLLRSELIDHWDFKIFVDVDFSTSVQRALNRDAPQGTGEFVVDILRMRYYRRYVSGQQIYIQEVCPKQKADVVLDNNHLDFPKMMKL
jgi:uridine kinase